LSMIDPNALTAAILVGTWVFVAVAVLRSER
jgi:hypothetical protein